MTWSTVYARARLWFASGRSAGPSTKTRKTRAAVAKTSAALFVFFSVVSVSCLSPIAAQAQTGLAGEPAPLALRPVFSSDGAKLASAGADGSVAVFDLESGQELTTVGDVPGLVAALAFSPDGQILAGARDNSVSLWSTADGSDIAVLKTEPGHEISRLAFSPGGDAVAAVLDGAEVVIWDVMSKATRTVLSRPGETVTEIAFSRDGQLIATSGVDAKISVWDLDAPQREPQTLSSPTNAPITGISFSPAGKTLAGADEDANITLWDLGSGGRTVLTAHADLIKRLSFSPNGSKLASEGTDAQLVIWDVASGQNQAALPARGDALVTGLAFSPDGTMLASIGENNGILLWEVSSGRLVQVLAGQAGLIDEVAFGAICADADQRRNRWPTHRLGPADRSRALRQPTSREHGRSR